jgi:hypothetical protein
MNLLRIYNTLLRLYPRDYRMAFAREMTANFNVAIQQRRVNRHRFTLAELASLVTGAAVEWIAKATSDPSIRGRSLPDVMLMRPPGVTREQWFGHV